MQAGNLEFNIHTYQICLMCLVEFLRISTSRKSCGMRSFAGSPKTGSSLERGSEREQEHDSMSTEPACKSTEPIVRRVAGIVILTSAALAWWVHPAWIALAAFAGFNLLQSSFTGFCPLEIILKKLDRS